MADRPPSWAGALVRRAAGKAKQMGETLRDEYRKGVEGDESPVATLGPSATARLMSLLRSRSAPTTDAGGHPPAPAGDVAEQDAAEVDQMLRGVDWGQVSTALRDHAAVQRMRDLAGQVDWGAARPVAAQVGAALIAATASGQLGGLGGRTGTVVARTIINETGLAERVAALGQRPPGAAGGSGPAAAPLSFIDTTATEGPVDFEAQLDHLRHTLAKPDQLD